MVENGANESSLAWLYYTRLERLVSQRNVCCDSNAVPILGGWAPQSDGSKRDGIARQVSACIPDHVLLISVMMSMNWTTNIIGEHLGKADFDEFDDVRRGAPQGRTAYPGYLRINTPVDLVLRGPIRVLYFLFSPFPWTIRSPLDVVGLLDSIIYAYMILVILRMWPYIRRESAVRLLMLIFVGMLIVFALSVSNTGTAIRHRAKLVVILIMIAGASHPFREFDLRIATHEMHRRKVDSCDYQRGSRFHRLA